MEVGLTWQRFQLNPQGVGPAAWVGWYFVVLSLKLLLDVIVFYGTKACGVAKLVSTPLRKRRTHSSLVPHPSHVLLLHRFVAALS